MTTSRQPRKQRKNLHNTELHRRKKVMSITLPKELREKLGKRNITPRKGDEVKVLRGKNKGSTGKITVIDYSSFRVGIEKITRRKKDGKEIHIMMQPSNLMIMALKEGDKRRKVDIKK